MSNENSLGFYKPAEGRVVAGPGFAKGVPAEGAWIPRSGFWQRRIDDNDLVKATPPAAAKSKAKD